MMSLFTCTSHTWRVRSGTVLSVVRQTLATRGSDGPTVKLDDANLSKLVISNEPPAHRIVDLQDLLRETTNEYEPDTHAINRMLADINPGLVWVLDSGAFPYTATHKVLQRLRISMFTRTEWPGAIVLVVGDEMIDGATNDLASAFYVQPNRWSAAEASKYAYNVSRAARYALFFMLSYNATSRISKYINRFKRSLLKLDESDLV